MSGEQNHASSPSLGTLTVAVDVAMTEIMRVVANSTELDTSTMNAIVQAVRQCVAGAEHVALTLVVRPRADGPVLEFGAASSRYARAAVRSELAERAGPTFDAVVRRRTVAHHNHSVRTRGEACRPADPAADAHDVLAVPLMDTARGSSMAVLTMWAASDKGFAAHSLIQAETVAALFSVALTSSRSQNQFHAALQSRDVIGQAKGMIMERFRIGADDAFTLLAKLSQDSNVPVVTVASNLVAAERLGDTGAADTPAAEDARPAG